MQEITKENKKIQRRVHSWQRNSIQNLCSNNYPKSKLGRVTNKRQQHPHFQHFLVRPSCVFYPKLSCSYIVAISTSTFVSVDVFLIWEGQTQHLAQCLVHSTMLQIHARWAELQMLVFILTTTSNSIKHSLSETVMCNSASLFFQESSKDRTLPLLIPTLNARSFAC